ncbi:dihydrolipoyl dehydrogenase family protein [Subtercola boreus]|uniref:Pyridine nucleotide-disulfide oxidoreductase n=1 Tax=Subtercola boreus TaxID=120213 RepID=A0A3E0WFC9_9MICO|nr:NAD(P)/FAD-dependent oxidoreductase [Subtercola boreus]RFA22803.1 pyridine nucleotide-disulfide oxidoreductase [Subtercola boreus]RFA23158.1 pyridine nucleotide-disulfide oxidoreductase [Subtercola boreus]RFA28911.1 pyridine nucleotide-disulfide oxidoreductase [Subtercola boreus]
MNDEPDTYDVAIIGAGPAGTAAALRAAELGARVVVLEADRVGGTCVNTGCVPTRVLAKTARLLRDAHHADLFGVSVGTPTIDWPATVARVNERVDAVRSIKREIGRFEEAGVTLIREGRARFQDDSTLVLDSGRLIRATSILICVGGHSRRLPIPGAELATVPEHVLSLAEIPRRVAVIGAGNTGAQLVTVFSSFGSQVTLLDVAPRVLMASDASISEVVSAAFAHQGVDVQVGIETVESLTRRADGSIGVAWQASGASKTVDVDAVIMATGWPADVEDLGLGNAGIEVVRSAIPADQYFRTIVPHIFAVGDSNGRDMLVQAAQFEGEAAAENAVLGANRRTPHHLLPAGGFTDPDYAGVGLTEEQARGHDELCVVASVPYTQLERAVIDGRELGFLKLISDRRRELILGAHAVGENAVEVIQSVTTAMAAGVDVSTLASVRFAYPTYSAVIGAAARSLLASGPSAR